VQDLIRMATERLLMKDSPSLEMVKMQVGFDVARVQETESLQKTREQVDVREGSFVKEISDARLKPGNDVEALTALYRKIFNFLVVRAGHEPGQERPAEREIAAALESVFPRIGLKAFTSLAPEDKAAQLHELANIVLGIRLFNRCMKCQPTPQPSAYAHISSGSPLLRTAGTSARVVQASRTCRGQLPSWRRP
jgi:hypothetical protein